MMKTVILLLSIFGFSGVLVSQNTVPDFTVTDSDGIEHTLYRDYLDKGITVGIKLFFVNCPPCNFDAPKIQTLYEEWGAGQADVQIFELTISSDNDAAVNGYKAMHGLTFPSVSTEGGASQTVQPYINGDFGAFFGTPGYFVIAPDGTATATGGGTSSRIPNFDAGINATGATGIVPPQPDPAIFNLSIEDSFGAVVEDVEIQLISASNPSLSYDIDLDNQQIVIQDLNQQFPGIDDPILRLSKSDDIRGKLTPLDILLIRKHILGLIPLEDEALLLAADTNGDGSINPLDMLVLQKVILGLFSEFPIPSHRFTPNEFPLQVTPGLQNIEIKASKTGDLNGF